MRRTNGMCLGVAALLLALSACDDEILTDVDIPKDASADRASDAPKEGANGDAGSEASQSDARAEASNDDAASSDAPSAIDAADGEAGPESDAALGD